MSRSSTTSPRFHSPTISNERDREFVNNLNAFIEKELHKTGSDEEQRYIVYKAAFDKIIDYVGAYKPLLTAIKAEYEDVIETIQRGQRESFYLSGKLKAVASGPSTIRNFRKRADELENNVAVIQSNNAKLKEQINALREARNAREKKSNEETEDSEKKVKRDKRTIPGLSLQQSTDPKTLNKELDKLDKQLKELTLAHKTRYTPKENKEKLKQYLESKVTLRDHLAEKADILKYKRQKLKVAVEAAQAYMKIQPPHQTIGDAVINALHRANSQGVLNKDDGTTSSAFEEDDPTKEKEAEMMLEYIEKFTELMEERKYEEAAVHAANSPKGILRTVETMLKFKDAVTKTSKGRSPLLAFCDAVLATVPAFGVRPNEVISLEAVQCALSETKHELIAHWITQDRLTFSEDMGDAIWQYATQKPKAFHCFALCQHIYSMLGLHQYALKCMMVQGKVKQVVQYAQTRAQFSTSDFVNLLREYPDADLAQVLAINETGRPALVPVITASTVLLESGYEDRAISLLEHLWRPDHPDKELPATALRKAMFNDKNSTSDQLLRLSKICDRFGHNEACLELAAASVVMDVVNNAKQKAFERDTNLQDENVTVPKKSSRLRFASISETDSDSIYPESSDYVELGDC